MFCCLHTPPPTFFKLLFKINRADQIWLWMFFKKIVIASICSASLDYIHAFLAYIIRFKGRDCVVHPPPPLINMTEWKFILWIRLVPTHLLSVHLLIHAVAMWISGRCRPHICNFLPQASLLQPPGFCLVIFDLCAHLNVQGCFHPMGQHLPDGGWQLVDKYFSLLSLTWTILRHYIYIWLLRGSHMAPAPVHRGD